MNLRVRLLKMLLRSQKIEQADNDIIAPEEDLLHNFVTRCSKLNKSKVLKMGTRRSIPTSSAHHKKWIPNAGEYLGTDIASGIDVNIVDDVHRLTEKTGNEQFDVIISCSSFEHFRYPHLATHEVTQDGQKR